jgi:hypothetical protein
MNFYQRNIQMSLLPEIWGVVASYTNEYVLLDFVQENIDKIDWFELSGNHNAVSILEKNIDKINWRQLSSNPNIFELSNILPELLKL